MATIAAGGTATTATASSVLMLMNQRVMQVMAQRRRRPIRIVFIGFGFVRRRRGMHRVIRTAPQRQPTTPHVQLPAEADITPGIDHSAVHGFHRSWHVVMMVMVVHRSR